MLLKRNLKYDINYHFYVEYCLNHFYEIISIKSFLWHELFLEKRRGEWFACAYNSANSYELILACV